MATTTVQFRMDSQLKSQLEQIFSQIGLNMTTGMNIYAKAVVNQGKIPFELKAPNFISTELQKDLKDVRNGKNLSKAYDNLDELFDDLEI